MQKAIIILSILLGYLFTLSAQQGISINADGSPAHASAILDVTSTSQGFLCPRLSIGQRNAIQSPALGLLIYLTNDTTGFYFYDGLDWQLLGTPGGFVPVCQLTATTTVTNVSSNGGSDGAATVTPSGGASPHTYQWSGGNASSQSTASATGLTAGSYCVTVTDNNNCTFTDCGISITEPGISSIGDFAHGGIAFYILQSGDPGYDANAQHGLVCTPHDIGSAEWGCFGTNITGAEGIVIGTGAQNTADIVPANCTSIFSGNPTAANICAAYTGGGYSDWHLPSRDELNEMYVNKTVINTTAGTITGGSSFANINYWSSTEVDPNNARDQNFVTGSQANEFKTSVRRIRAVRAF